MSRMAASPRLTIAIREIIGRSPSSCERPWASGARHATPAAFHPEALTRE